MKLLSNDGYRHLKALAGIAALALAGCSSNAPSSTPAPTAAPASSAAASAPLAPPSGDMGSVVFFRPSKFVGGMVSFKVREGEQELGKLANGTYFVAQVPVGPHAFTVHSEAKDILNLEVERGETYYVEGSISMGVLVGRPNLAPSSESAFTAVKTKLKDSAASKK